MLKCSAWPNMKFTLELLPEPTVLCPELVLTEAMMTVIPDFLSSLGLCVLRRIILKCHACFKDLHHDAWDARHRIEHPFFYVVHSTAVRRSTSSGTRQREAISRDDDAYWISGSPSGLIK